MKSEYYEKIHKWPKGFKKKVCEFYNEANLRIFNYKGHRAIYKCAWCGSTNKVGIHHYSEHNGVYARYIDEKGNVDWDDMSKYISFCASCHGTIESCAGEVVSKGVPPLTLYLREYMETVHFDLGYWWKERDTDSTKVERDRKDLNSTKSNKKGD